MVRVTTKRHVTVPAGKGAETASLGVDERLRIFDAACARQRERKACRTKLSADSRGWTREELYERGGKDAV